MNNEKELIEKYPKIFIDAYKDPKETCMHWGLECSDGWYDLIDQLCQSLQWMTDKNNYPQVIADQVKEKFGTLRFYYHLKGDKINEAHDAFIAGMVNFAESMSGMICEGCGAKGKSRRGGWIQTLCDKCWENKKNKPTKGKPMYEVMFGDEEFLKENIKCPKTKDELIKFFNIEDYRELLTEKEDLALLTERAKCIINFNKGENNE